ncbi:hypothetical protein DL93DRAFT_1201562 [Clavulina sp. PMI_390]|nr:hypothetical protein DL93DRAFT_1201562 [Clavulina sp. PMI_390]
MSHVVIDDRGPSAKQRCSIGRRPRTYLSSNPFRLDPACGCSQKPKRLTTLRLSGDQQRINTFSKLNRRCEDLEERLEEKKAERSALDDLEQELELSLDEEPVFYKVGETFVRLPFNQAKKRLAADQATTSQAIEALQNQLEEHAEEMKQLKITLYGKFGKSINLD